MSSKKLIVSRWLLKNLFYFRHKKFHQALLDPKKSQDILFKKISANLSNSLYGESLNLAKNMTYADFSQRVPIVKYDDLLPWIEIIKMGKHKVLTPQAVKHLEKTSGSSGPAKYIPYTANLLRSFNHMFQIWVYDVLKNGPRLETGRVFMSISPPIQNEPTANSNIPIGFENDSEYLKKLHKWFINDFFIFPANLREKQPIEDFQRNLAKTLLSEEKLEIISIWSPSYLLALLDLIQSDPAYFVNYLNKPRKQFLSMNPIPWQKIWPNLKIISCWTSATAAYRANILQQLFPTTLIQSKGLLATEAPITIPFIHALFHVPLVNEVFLEFFDNQGQIKLIQELNQGETYQIILSQQGGLYRYNLEDKVKVMDFYKNTPCLEFMGRGACSDLVGEKFTDEFVMQALNNVFEKLPVSVLIPTIDAKGRGKYILLIDQVTENVIEKIENEFSENYHYQNARILGQLAKAAIIHQPNLQKIMHEFYLNKGMRLGDIKDRILLPDLDQAKDFMQFVNHPKNLMNDSDD